MEEVLLYEKDLMELSQRSLKVLVFGIVGLVVGFVFTPTIISTLIEFFKVNAVSLKPTEAFNVYMMLSITMGFLFLFPMLILQTYYFIRVGLYEKERQILNHITIMTVPLFALGNLVGLGVSILSMRFLTNFSVGMGLESYWGIESIITHVTTLMLLFGTIFVITPIAINVSIKYFGLTKKNLVKYSIYTFPLIALIAGFITPPDLFSQIALIIPIYGLIGGTIIMTKGRWE